MIPAERAPRLSDKHQRVVDEYFLDYNKAAAMKRAGYAYNYCNQPGNVFDRQDVSRAIEKRQQMLAKKHEVTASWVIEKWKEVVESSIGDVLVIEDDGTAYLDLNKATPALLSSLSEYTVDEFTEGTGSGKKKGKRVRIKLHDKLKALDAIAKNLGMFTEKLQISGSVDLVGRIQQGRERARLLEENRIDEEV